MNNLELVAFVKQKIGTPYVYGAKGQVLTESMLNSLSNNYKSIFTQSYINKAKRFIGKVCIDCSGLISWGIGKIRGSANYFDTAIQKGDIKNIPEIAGLAVYKKGHIGIYIGNGKVVEAKGIDYGVVETNLSDTKWTHYLYLCDISYDTASKTNNSIVKCIDVSAYQGIIDWKMVSSVVNKAILKIIRKDLNPDKHFEEYWSGCRKNDIDIVGVYNYSYATTIEKAILDAKTVLNVLNGRKTKIWLDVEDKCQQGLGALLIDIINEYQNLVESNGYEFGLYTGQSFYNSYIKPYKNKLKCQSFWIARYYNGYNAMDINVVPNEKYNPKNNIGLSAIDGWQYTSSGIVSGINGNVDISLLYSSSKADNTSNYQIGADIDYFILGKVNTINSTLNIRQKPTTSSNVIGQYQKNELVNIVAKHNDWLKTNKGYVLAKYIKQVNGKVSNCNKLNVRNLPSTDNSSILKVINLDDRLQIIEKTNVNWYKVQIGNIKGYVSAKYITYF